MLFLWLLANPDLNVRVWAFEPVSPLLNISVLSMSHVSRVTLAVSVRILLLGWQRVCILRVTLPFFLSERCVALATLVLSLSCIQPCFKLPVTHSSWQELILGSSCSANQKYRHPGKWGQSGQTQHFPPRLLIICFPFYCSSISILKDIFESQSWLGF